MKNIITIIIISYNSNDTIESNLEALKDGYDSKLLRVIVVDNDSQDDTVKIVQKKFPWVDLVENKTNLGYGSGLNLGLSMTESPYVLFMNPDAILSTEELLKLIQFMDNHPKAGIVAPAIKRRNDAYQEAGGLPTPLGILSDTIGFVERTIKRKTIEPGGAPFVTDWLCGAIMLCRAEIINELKGFDSGFFLYYEETDLCIRVQAKGYELWAIGQAVATHESNSSARKIDPSLETGGCLGEHYYESRYYYIRKHYGWLASISVEIGELIIYTLKDLLTIILRRPNRKRLLKRLQYPLFKLPKHLHKE